MLRNYLKIAWRNLIRNRSYALINIIGLAIGLACFMLIILYVQEEMGYDNFHEKGDQIYRMALERKYPGRSRQYAFIPQSYASVVKNDYAEVAEVCRLFYFQGNNTILKVGEQLFEEPDYMWADTTFFDLFDIHLLQGDRKAALVEPNSVVLTESIAKKYFGDRDAMGQTIEIPGNNNNNLLVTGVCADVPDNSHLKFNILSSSTSLNFLEQPNFINFSAYTYLLLNSNADPAQLESKLPETVVKYASGQVLTQFGVDYEEYQRQGNGYRYFLQPLQGIYLDSNLEAEIKPPGSRQRLYFFLLIAILILAIACINFMNLATARSAGRAREVGIRKTLGSDRRQIAGQFLLEAVIISTIAAVIGAGLNYLVLSGFNGLTNKSFSLEHLLHWKYLVKCVCVSQYLFLYCSVCL